jgi:hypothetical protein
VFVLAFVIAWLVVVVGAAAFAGWRAFKLTRRVRRIQMEVDRRVHRILAGVATATKGSNSLQVQGAEAQLAMAHLQRSLAELQILLSAAREAKSGFDRFRRYFAP